MKKIHQIGVLLIIILSIVFSLVYAAQRYEVRPISKSDGIDNNNRIVCFTEKGKNEYSGQKLDLSLVINALQSNNYDINDYFRFECTKKCEFQQLTVTMYNNRNDNPILKFINFLRKINSLGQPKEEKDEITENKNDQQQITYYEQIRSQLKWLPGVGEKPINNECCYGLKIDEKTGLCAEKKDWW